MNNKELIHVQLNHEDALESKKETLSSEIGLLKIKKNMQSYHHLRKEELKEKLKLYRRIKELEKIINNLQKNLPQIHIPEKLQKPKIPEQKINKEIERKIEKTRESSYDKNLERQLREIQEKLRAME